MRLSWSQHLQAARTLETSRSADLGTSFALMGMALLMLSEDLLAQEQTCASAPARWQSDSVTG
ncbi:hypothetical protein SynWH8101_1847 [Synechococcus sp. WH 8101]|uniref:hypothetical protein n=1 Tax=Synechococcus sp. WH 8101 TaxID=59932 RepID=UPI0010239100|nr:hypothetical protein [Synechococcus sp. WH 8101]QBE69429.1 hypothetical protein SynWH8101_1847 [Synechococcus sp. WH 8101]QNI45677.1 hypothetical protein SynRCC2555_01896 [Synechococcus sp. WH 8101]